MLNSPENVTKSEINEYFWLIADNVKWIRLEKGMNYNVLAREDSNLKIGICVSILIDNLT